MPLTDRAVKALKPGTKTYKRHDEKGLYIVVRPLPSGAKFWQHRFRFGGREQTDSFGQYPEVGLAAARKKLLANRALLLDGVNPMESKRARKRQVVREQAGTFEAVGRDWLAKMAVEWNATHHTKVRQRLERDVFPRLGKRPTSEIDAPEVLVVLRRIADRGSHETAKRARQNIGAIMRRATALGYAQGDPTTALVDELPTPETEHFPAITDDPVRFGELLAAIDQHVGAPAVGLALRLAPYVAVRAGELQSAEWAHIDLDERVWSMPRERTKTRQAHMVPLSRQAVSLLEEARELPTHGRYVFASPRQLDRPISNMALGKALHALGFKDEHTPHGFRASFRTMAAERLGVPEHLLEHSLSHVVRDPLGRAYNRTTFLEERRKLMQRWSDYVDRLKRNTAQREGRS